MCHSRQRHTGYCVGQLNDLNDKVEAAREVNTNIKKPFKKISTILSMEVFYILFLPRPELEQV